MILSIYNNYFTNFNQKFMKILTIISIFTAIAFYHESKQVKLTQDVVDYFYCKHQANLLDTCN